MLISVMIFQIHQRRRNRRRGIIGYAGSLDVRKVAGQIISIALATSLLYLGHITMDMKNNRKEEHGRADLV